MKGYREMKSNNPFSAFGFSADDATVDTLRTDLAFALRTFIERAALTQKKAAETLGLTQNIVSHIVRGDIQHLSVERLIRAMVRAKITGFAEWGGSAEMARAGSGTRPGNVYIAANAFSVVHDFSSFESQSSFLPTVKTSANGSVQQDQGLN